MNLNINLDILRDVRKVKLMICTPMYGGNCTGVFANACQQTSALLSKFGVPHYFHFLYNESLIQRARNYCADAFMRSDFTHMLFIDADISFTPDQVLSLLWLQTEDSPYDVIAATYPKKTISWEKIRLAVNKGLADQNPNELEKYVGDFVFNFPPGATKFNLFSPCEVMETGTGFMMIRRETFDAVRAAMPQYLYLPDHVRSNEFDGTREIMAYFDCIIDPETRRYLSEDYFFCQNVRKIGMKVWMCPWINLVHFGTMPFTGSLVAMAQNGVTLTANASELSKPLPPIDASRPPATPIQPNLPVPQPSPVLALQS